MQSTDIPAKLEGPRPKRPPRWRDLSDEEQWGRIYKDREKKAAVEATINPAKATALGLPSYVLQMAIDDCHKTFQATIRHDVHVAIVTSMAKVASMLKTEKKRQKMLTRMHAHYGTLKNTGFFLHNREFLYATAAATVRLVDDYRFPPDAPVVPASIMLKEDAESDEAGDWALDMAHAVKMTGILYDGFLDTELYRYPDANMNG